MAVDDFAVPLVKLNEWFIMGARSKISSCQSNPSPKAVGLDNAANGVNPPAERLSFIRMAYSSAFKSAMYFQGS